MLKRSFKQKRKGDVASAHLEGQFRPSQNPLEAPSTGPVSVAPQKETGRQGRPW